MKTTLNAVRRFRRAWACFLFAWTALPGWSSVTLHEFGYQRIDPGSSRPLLVVLGDFDTLPERRITRSNDYYHRLFFDRNTYPSLNGFLWENSAGRFQVTPAGPGVLGPFVMSTNETFPAIVSKYPAEAETIYYSNVIRRAIASQLVDLTAFDANGNLRIEPAELSWSFMNNYGGGASRGTPVVPIPGSSYSVGGCWSSGIFPNSCYITANFAQGDFESMAHEQLHQLGVLDLYGRMGMGCPNGNFTTMSCTVPGELAANMNNSNFWYLAYTWNSDPWNRMLFGWCEPRLVSMNQGGRFTLPAAQLHHSDAPILLYDPDAKFRTNDYYLLEYRTPNTKSAGHGYDANVGSAGLVIWHFHPDDPQWHVPFVYTEGPPDFVAGSGTPWPGGSTTPNLRHRPNYVTGTRVYVHPFQADADAIEIEIKVNAETYVDFDSNLTPETGSYIAPYNTLAEGVAAASWGGTIYFKGGGHTAETIRIEKATTLKSYGTGAATLGR